MVDVPAETPVTTPVEELTEAFELLLVQAPPPASVRVVVNPVQTFVVPDMLPGSAFTVTGAVT
jgi:hypothetical protein